MLSVPAFIRAKLHFAAAETVGEPASRNTTLLLAGAFALVVLVLSETTLLTFARNRIGVAPSRQPTAHWKAEPPDLSGSARAMSDDVAPKARVVARHVQR